jgi:hypothetical protein
MGDKNMLKSTSEYQKTREESLKNVLQNITNVDVKNEPHITILLYNSSVM